MGESEDGVENLIVRPAREEDYGQILLIEQFSFRQGAWDEAALRRYPCLVADRHSLILGYLLYRVLSPAEPECGQAAEQEILSLAVHPEWRRKGVAKAILMSHFRRGVTYYLEVRESNLAARKLYESLGFKNSGNRLNYYDNPRESAIVMGLDWW